MNYSFTSSHRWPKTLNIQVQMLVKGILHTLISFDLMKITKNHSCHAIELKIVY